MFRKLKRHLLFWPLPSKIPRKDYVLLDVVYLGLELSLLD